MKMFHRCESKVYSREEATQHPHAKNPMACVSGWRKATTREQVKRVCHCCGKEVVKMSGLGSNKRNIRHKCPHGKWCASGSRTAGIHANHNINCEECLRVKL